MYRSTQNKFTYQSQHLYVNANKVGPYESLGSGVIFLKSSAHNFIPFESFLSGKFFHSIKATEGHKTTVKVKLPSLYLKRKEKKEIFPPLSLCTFLLFLALPLDTSISTSIRSNCRNAFTITQPLSFSQIQTHLRHYRNPGYYKLVFVEGIIWKILNITTLNPRVFHVMSTCRYTWSKSVRYQCAVLVPQNNKFKGYLDHLKPDLCL